MAEVNGEVKRVHRAMKIVAAVGEFRSKAAAREHFRTKEVLDQLNRAIHTPEQTGKLCEFVDQVYLPHIKEQKRPSTYRGYNDMWEDHLRHRCEGTGSRR